MEGAFLPAGEGEPTFLEQREKFFLHDGLVQREGGANDQRTAVPQDPEGFRDYTGRMAVR